MIFFNNDLQLQIIELKLEIANLRTELHHNTRIHISDGIFYDYFSIHLQDTRKAVMLKDVVLQIVENLGLEIKEAPAVISKVVLSSKVKVKK